MFEKLFVKKEESAEERAEKEEQEAREQLADKLAGLKTGERSEAKATDAEKKIEQLGRKWGKNGGESSK